MYYHEHLPDREDFRQPPMVGGSTYSHYAVQASDRAWWLREGLRRGVQLGWLIEYNIPEMASYGGHPPEMYPHAARLARHTINLPVWGGAPVARKVVDTLIPLLGE